MPCCHGIAKTGHASAPNQLQVSGNATSTPARLLLIPADVDHFKARNDHFGHPAGNEVLRQVATSMLDCVPDAALLARYRCEEFACLLPGADTARGVVLAERMRAAAEACRIPIPGAAETIQVNISAGIAITIIGERNDTHHLLRDAIWRCARPDTIIETLYTRASKPGPRRRKVTSLRGQFGRTAGVAVADGQILGLQAQRSSLRCSPDS